MFKYVLLALITPFIAFGAVLGSYSLLHTDQPDVVAPMAVVRAAVAPNPPNAHEILIDVNNERAKVGELPLVENYRLDLSAAAKCGDMVDNHYEDHISPTGVSWLSFIQRIYGTNYNKVGENLSENYPTSASAVAGWMGSPLHRQNILDPAYTDVGTAVCNTNWIVQHFEG